MIQGKPLKVANEDLILGVSRNVDPGVWDEYQYDRFLDALCGNREYQKEAIRTAARYLFGARYKDLSELVSENWSNDKNGPLQSVYKTFEGLKSRLLFADKLSANIDLATGTGKSYVIFGIACLALATKKYDQVLVLCPSTTIESGLLEKFVKLGSDPELIEALGISNPPRIINSSETITAGSICIENYHQILKSASGSIRDSLKGKGQRTLVLNDESHHIYSNSSGSTNKAELKKWTEFLNSTDFNFSAILGFSGTCYQQNKYFADVIYRYSLKEAIEDGVVKRVNYVVKDDGYLRPEQKWQVVIARHEEIKKKLISQQIKPITIVVTQTIQTCNQIAEEFKEYLAEATGLSESEVNEKVLIVHGRSKENFRLVDIDNGRNSIEWVFSVSMLTEGWDVKRVFQIIPHEERAFNSKLLISQVLGRGLRIPDSWKTAGGMPYVEIYNHAAWASTVKQIVDEVLEVEEQLTSRILVDSPFNFEIQQVTYEESFTAKEVEKQGTYNLYEKGFVNLPATLKSETQTVEYADLLDSTRLAASWKTTVHNKTYSVEHVVKIMHERLMEEELGEEYASQYSIEFLTEIVEESLRRSGNSVITDETKQRLLQSLGTVRRSASKIVSLVNEPKDYIRISTRSRSSYSTVSLSALRSDKTLFYTNQTRASLSEEEKDTFDHVTNSMNRISFMQIENSYLFKTPLNLVIADSSNEAQFIEQIVNLNNSQAIKAWIKSPNKNLYSIEYSWRRGNHQKRSNFNPDFFLLTESDRVVVVEIKGDEEIKNMSPELAGKFKSATNHFKVINQFLEESGDSLRYKFTMLTPKSFKPFFERLKAMDQIGIDTYISHLDADFIESDAKGG